MMDFEDNTDNTDLDMESSKALLRDLEENTPDAIRRQRRHFRVEIKSAVTLQPGNASQLMEGKVKGISGDVSEGGMSGLFPLPVNVGDIYRLSFDRQTVDLPMLYARCVRCRFIRENAYEAGFAFFALIHMPASLLERAR